MFEALSGVPDASRGLQIRNRLGTITSQKAGDVCAVEHERNRIEHDHSAQPEPEASRSGNFGRTGYEEREQGEPGHVAEAQDPAEAEARGEDRHQCHADEQRGNRHPSLDVLQEEVRVLPRSRRSASPARAASEAA